MFKSIIQAFNSILSKIEQLISAGQQIASWGLFSVAQAPVMWRERWTVQKSKIAG
jgi:hypothetical protein